MSAMNKDHPDYNHEWPGDPEKQYLSSEEIEEARAFRKRSEQLFADRLKYGP